jgi:hypothetical protein
MIANKKAASRRPFYFRESDGSVTLFYWSRNY